MMCKTCTASMVSQPSAASSVWIDRQCWSRVGGPNGRTLRTIVATPEEAQALGDTLMQEAMLAVKAFSDFSKDNDPWGEHDFGAVEIGGQKIFWKLDYYDPSLTAGSENPANEAVTHRVLTIMLASEY